MSGGKGFEQERFGCVCISCRTEEEIERISLRSNRSVEGYPLLLYLDGDLVNTP